MTPWERYFLVGRRAGCPKDQMQRFERADVVLQERQLVASAAARLCDQADGPTAIGYGGARGGGKSHWLLAQMGVDDCQRVPGLKCLLLRKVGKANLEHFEDLRRKLFTNLGHEFSAFRGILTFNNGSRIIAGHFQNERDIDAYLGLEYDVIGIEEATTLTARKIQDVSTCCRTSKPNWRPRLYNTTNPGGVGHGWYRKRFIEPWQRRAETETRFIAARVTDNRWNNPEYIRVLQGLSGWQRRAWLDGDWDIAAGQFFTTLRREVHVVPDFDDTRAREWFADAAQHQSLQSAAAREQELAGRVKTLRDELDTFLKARGLSTENLSDVGKATERIAQLDEGIGSLDVKVGALKAELGQFTAQRVKAQEYAKAVEELLAPVNVALKGQGVEVKPIELRYRCDLKAFKDAMIQYVAGAIGPIEGRAPRPDYVESKLGKLDFSALTDRAAALKQISDEDGVYAKTLRDFFAEEANFEALKLEAELRLLDVRKLGQIFVLYDDKPVENSSFGQRCTAVITTPTPKTSLLSSPP